MKRRLRLGLLIGVLVMLVVAAIMKHGDGHQENPRVTKETLDRIPDGMTQAGVEEILGPPTAVEVHQDRKSGRFVAWESRRTENHFVYARIITLSFDASGRKSGPGQFTDCQVDFDSWLRFKYFFTRWSPWLAKRFP
jgi:hypothetical protein